MEDEKSQRRKAEETQRLDVPSVSGTEMLIRGLGKPAAGTKPDMTLPSMEGSVLSRVKQFLPELQAANEKLKTEMASTTQEAFDIEHVGADQPHIEMDLACGLWDLQSKDAVKAAEAAVAGTLPDSDPKSDSDTSSSDSDSDDQEVDPAPTSGKQKKHSGILEIT